MIRPRPYPPYAGCYSDWAEFERVQQNYLADLAEWQREFNFHFWMNAAPVICATVACIVLAVVGPSIGLDMIRILNQ